MRFDFNLINDRRSTNSVKWNVKSNELPMWVADMDIQTAPEIIEAMYHDVDRGIFGYQYVPDKYYKAVANWYREEHNFEPDTDWLVYSNGIMPTIGSLIRHLTDVGDKVLLQEPNYNAFFKVIANNGRHTLNSELEYVNGQYKINWKDLETKLLDPETTAMIICNPHNPSGHIWDKETLIKLGRLANQHHVLIISDEIHGDLTMPGYDYTPFASLDADITKNSISLASPSKTFNLAILHASTMMIPNKELRERAIHAVSVDGINEPGILAIDASIAAYTKGHEWLHELRKYIQENREYLEKYVQENISEIKVLPAQSTYLAWIDCSKITNNSEELNEYLRGETGLYLAEGTKYRGNGNKFLRMNLATPRTNVEDGLQRLKTGIAKYISQE